MKLRPWLLVSILAFLLAPALQSQQQFNFDDLAQQFATAIQKSTTASSSPANVLVLNFDETHATSTELGPELSNEFAASLRKYAQGFDVIQPGGLHLLLADHNLPETVATYPPAMRCYAPDLGVSVLIEGGLDYAGDGVVLRVHAWRAKDHESIFAKMIIVPITAPMEQLMAEPLPDPPPFFTQEKRVWVNKDHPPANDADVVDLTKEKTGYAYPSCLHCPHPEYSDAAVRPKMEGKIVLRVQVSHDGFPSKISLLQGIPCGLTDKAFEAVEHWKFSPATGPDGAPVAVELPIEVHFRLY
jgi:TonB family protein